MDAFEVNRFYHKLRRANQVLDNLGEFDRRPSKRVSLEQRLFDLLEDDLQKGYPEYSDDQPRGEDGRWSGGGGGSASLRRGSEAGDLYARNVKRAGGTPLVDDFVAGLPEAQRSYIRESRRKLANATPTDALVSQGGFKVPFADGESRWTAARQRIHEAIIRDTIADALERASPDEGEKPNVVLMGGRGGAGKSTALERSGLVENMGDYIYLNADDIKEQLPGYEGWNASLFHEESSHIVDQVERIARDLGLNIIFDATLKSEGSAVKRVDLYEAAGYSVTGFFVHTTPVTSATRAMSRALTSGRFVEPAYILSSTTNESTFDVVKKKMDRWVLFDNNGKFNLRVIAEGSRDRRTRRRKR